MATTQVVRGRKTPGRGTGLERPGRRLAGFLAAAAVILAPAGCVPSDAEIESELSAVRRAAYVEWKSRRERGESLEARVNGPLSLDDAVRVSLNHNKQLQSAIQEREATRGGRISAYQVVLPSFAASGGLGHVESANGAYLDNYSLGFTVSQPVLDGAMAPTLRRARFGTALADETVRSQVQSLISSVAGTYYDVLLAQRMVDVQREALASAEAQHRMVSEKKRQETATEYDVLRAQVDVATYRAGMQSAMNDIDTGRVSLLKLMGVSQDSEVVFSDQLEFIPMRPILERAMEIAFGLRPDIRQAELGLRREREALRIARSQFMPSLAATFRQNWSDGAAGGNFSRNPWDLSLGASYKLGIDAYGGLIAAKAKLKQSEMGILDAQETALKEIRQYTNSLANAEETVKALEVNQDAAREALRLALVGYQAGVKTEVDVADARKALTEVMGRYYQALSNHTKARLNLQVAMGVLGPARIDDNLYLTPNVPIANIKEFAAADYVPPEPIPMPQADPHAVSASPLSGIPAEDLARVIPRRRETGKLPAAKATGGAAQPTTAPAAASPPVRAVGSRSGSAAAGPAENLSGKRADPAREPVAVRREISREPPVLSLPIPPDDSSAAPAPASADLTGKTAGEAFQPRPLFRISVRNDSSGNLPEVAKADR